MDSVNLLLLKSGNFFLYFSQKSKLKQNCLEEREQEDGFVGGL